jgi:hypothetical protein
LYTKTGFGWLPAVLGCVLLLLVSCRDKDFARSAVYFEKGAQSDFRDMDLVGYAFIMKNTSDGGGT